MHQGKIRVPSPEDKEGLRTGNKQRASNTSWKHRAPQTRKGSQIAGGSDIMSSLPQKPTTALARNLRAQHFPRYSAPFCPPSPAPNLSALAQHRTSSRKPKAPLRPPQVRWDSRAEQVEEASDKVLAVRMQSLSAPSAPGWK